jgi:hypothetical protein
MKKQPVFDSELGELAALMNAPSPNEPMYAEADADEIDSALEITHIGYLDTVDGDDLSINRCLSILKKMTDTGFAKGYEVNYLRKYVAHTYRNNGGLTL